MSKQFSDLVAQSIAIRDHYNELQEKDGHAKWGASERMSGFIADVGDLSKLIMAKKGFRRGPDDIDEALEHEISDCLWSILVIADELHIDLESSFEKWVDQMHVRIEQEKVQS